MRADSSAYLAILCSPAVFKLYLQIRGQGRMRTVWRWTDFQFPMSTVKARWFLFMQNPWQLFACIEDYSFLHVLLLLAAFLLHSYPEVSFQGSPAMANFVKPASLFLKFWTSSTRNWQHQYLPCQHTSLWGWRKQRYVHFQRKACFRDYFYAPILYFVNLEGEYFFLQVVLKLIGQTSSVEFGCKHVSKQKKDKIKASCELWLSKWRSFG